jgi:hypothetical protein
MQHFKALKTRTKFAIPSILGLCFVLVTFGCATSKNQVSDFHSDIDYNLNGTWVEGHIGEDELKMNNGYFESFHDGEPFLKGTYTATDGMYDTKITHFYGSGFYLAIFGLKPLLENNWYSIHELRTLLSSNYSLTDTEIENLGFNRTSPPSKYYIVENKLFFYDEYGGEGLYIKK